MSEARSSIHQGAMTRSLAAQIHTFPSAPSSTSDPQSSSTTSTRRRRASHSPTTMGATGASIEQDKPRKAKAAPNRSGAIRGSIMTMPHLLPGEEITYTPTTHRISKAKKGKKVHGCTFPGCPKIFTRAEHRKRHEANHNAHPAFQCQMEGCKKPFQRADLLARHMERQHNVPIDTLSTRSHRSYGSMSETGSPGGVNLSIPHLQHHSTSPPLPQTSGAMSIGSIIEHNMHNEYRTHSVPPNLHDHLSSQPIGTAPRSLRPEMLYGLSPSGDSLYSSSDSCYSPLSDYLQAPQPLPQQYYAPDLVQRPQSAIETCYQSMEASPLSVGPPTAVQSWNNYDPAALGFAPETQCIPPLQPIQQQQYRHTSFNACTGASNIPFYEVATPPQSTWPWTKVHF